MPSIHYGEIYTQYGTVCDKTVSRVRPSDQPEPALRSHRRRRDRGVVETVEDVGKAVAWLGDEPTSLSTTTRFSVRRSTEPDVRLVLTCRRPSSIAERRKYVARAKVKRISKARPRQVRDSCAAARRAGADRRDPRQVRRTRERPLDRPPGRAERAPQAVRALPRPAAHLPGERHERGAGGASLRADRGRRPRAPSSPSSSPTPRRETAYQSEAELEAAFIELLRARRTSTCAIPSEAAARRQPARAARGAERRSSSPTPSGSGSSPRRSRAPTRGSSRRRRGSRRTTSRCSRATTGRSRTSC